MASYKRIDAHHHFWKYKPELFPWITPELSVVARDFLPEEFASVIREHGIDSTVAIHNFRSLEETQAFMKYAETYPWIEAVVGWFPLNAANLEELIEPYLGNHKIVGAREILQFPDVAPLFQDKAFQAGLNLVSEAGLSFDLLVGPWQLKDCIQTVDAHPELQFILSHLGKPPIALGDLTEWSRDFKDIAKRGNVACKLSGLPLEADFPNWSESDLQPAIELALECFGPQRLMFGSDWPPCLMATTYGKWIQVVERSLDCLSLDEQAQIWSGTAQKIYKLPG